MTSSSEKQKTQNKFPIRLLDISNAEEIRNLTALLDIAYRDRANKNVYYLPPGQDEPTTLRRIEGKECWVVEIGGRMVATVTIASPEKTSGTWWYRQKGVAEVSQIAVHPNFRMFGLFSFLMDFAELRCIEMGAIELAGSVPTQRKSLLDAYLKRGCRIVDYKWKRKAKYGSAVFSKTLTPPGVKSPVYVRILRKFKYYRRCVQYKLLNC